MGFGPGLPIPSVEQAKQIATYTIYGLMTINTILVALAIVAFAKHRSSSTARWHLAFALTSFAIVYYVEQMQLHLIGKYEIYSYLIVSAILLALLSIITTQRIFGIVVFDHLKRPPVPHSVSIH